MVKVHLGSLSVGDIPRVVGTISNKQTLMSLNEIEWPPCDIIEVRLDEIGGSVETWYNYFKSLENRMLPIILTIRPEFEGGKWLGKEEDRYPEFQKALSIVSSVDIEYKSKIISKICDEASRYHKPVVVSYHNFKETPKLEDLKKILSEMSTLGNVIAKISTMVNSFADVDQLRHLLDDDWGIPVCVIGMGAKGTRTRTSFPAIGSCLTYGYIDVPSAPGQLPCSLLTEQLRLSLSEFNEDVIIRHQVLEYV